MMMCLTKSDSALSRKKVPAFSTDACVNDRPEISPGWQASVAVARRGGKGSRGERGERRRRIDPTTCERDYNQDDIEFMKAMDQYKRDNRRPFPTWSETLEVLRAIGYRKVAEPAQMPGLSTAMPPLHPARLE
jgi:hypothetical protein